MKKKCFWMAAIAVTVSMTSCSLEEVVEQPAPQAIGFSPFVGKPTKGVTEIVNPGTSTGGTPLSTFYVFGRYGASTGTYDKEVYNNAAVTVSSINTDVGPDNVQYWVPNKYYKFAAYSDGNSQINGTDGNSPTVSFGTDGNITISNYSANTKDLILAMPGQVSTGATISSQPNAVQLTFNHLLSQVSFQFVGSGFPTGYKIKIEGLMFSVNNTATYTGPNTSGSWDTPTTSATKSYSVNSGSSFAFGTETKSDANFVIPQSYSSDIKATFKATIYDNHDSEVATKDFETVSLLATTAAANSGGTPSIPTQWVAGYRYQYNITINPNNMGNMYPIEFTVTKVEGWQDKETNGYETGINTPSTASN